MLVFECICLVLHNLTIDPVISLSGTWTTSTKQNKNNPPRTLDNTDKTVIVVNGLKLNLGVDDLDNLGDC